MHLRFVLLRSAGISMLVTLSLISGMSAQQSAGTITGRVLDPSQGVLQGAQIQLQPGGRTALSDTNGEFTINDLSPGRYTLTVSHEGYGVYTSDVTVTANNS